MAMQQRTTPAPPTLYTSQWWARLAAISEQGEKPGHMPEMVETRKPKREPSRFVRTLLSLFNNDQRPARILLRIN